MLKYHLGYVGSYLRYLPTSLESFLGAELQPTFDPISIQFRALRLGELGELGETSPRSR